MSALRQTSYFLHAALWAGLAVAAYEHAGSYAFASCWGIALVYYPPLTLALLLIAFYSLCVLMGAWYYPRSRRKLTFVAAVHGVLLTAGLIGARVAAYKSAGQVSCL